MKSHASLDNSTCAEQIQLAERQFASFIDAVKELFGPEQARLSADDWLEEVELMEGPFRHTSRDCRAVTVAAAARLAGRLTAARDRGALVAPTRMNVSPIPSSNCLSFTILMG